MILVPRIIGKVHGGIAASMFTQVKLSTLLNGLVFKLTVTSH